MNKDAVYDALDDPYFQAFTVKVGITQTVEPEQLQQLASIHPLNDSSRLLGRAFAVFQAHPGTMLSYPRLIRLIDDRHLQADKVRHVVNDIRQQLPDQKTLTTLRGGGAGYGVTGYGLTTSQTAVLHALYRHPNSPTKLSSLSDSVYGNIHHESIQGIKVHLYALRRLSAEYPGLVIYQSDNFASLITRPPQESAPIPLELDLPQYLTFPFQQWLRQPDVQVIQPIDADDPVLRPIEKLTDLERKVHTIFRHFPQAIIPIPYFARVLYKDPAYSAKNVRQIVNKYRAKLSKPELVQNSEHLGYLTGAQINLPKASLAMLHALWHARGQALTSEQIIEHLAQQGFDIGTNTFTHNLGNIISHFRHAGNFEILIKRGYLKVPSTYSLRLQDTPHS